MRRTMLTPVLARRDADNGGGEDLVSGDFIAGAGGPTAGVGIIQGGDSESWAEAHDWGGPFGTLTNTGDVAVLWDIPGSNDTYLILRGDYEALHQAGTEFIVSIDDGVSDLIPVQFVPLEGWGHVHPSEGTPYHSVWINADDQLGMVDETEYTFRVEQVPE